MRSAEGLLYVKFASDAAGTYFIDTNPWFCTSDACPLIVNHIPVYLADRDHVSEHYSLFLVNLVEQALDNAGVH